MKRKSEKDPRDRKSPGSAELWRKQKKARNAARGKQVFLNGTWTRTTATS